VPAVIDYPAVLEQMRGFKCNYYNSGAFSFGPDVDVEIVGWMGPPDPTIKPHALDLAIKIPEPYESNLAQMFIRAWRANLSGRVWVMPMSHWAYELDYGSPEWMPGLLQQIGIDPAVLQPRSNASAIEFVPDEAPGLERCIEGLLRGLAQSDFAITFPGRPVIILLHHHKQLWWQTTDESLAQKLREMAQKM
jgi:hypothetical protein